MAPTEINHTTHANKHKHVYMFEMSDGVIIWKENQNCTFAKQLL